MADVRLCAAAFACAAIALPDRVALAQPTDGESRAIAPESQPLEPAEQARLLYRQAESKYAAGDVEGALELMEQSYALSGRAELLFNLGQLNRELGRCRPALDRYRQYLEQAPAGRRREDAAHGVAELGALCPEPPTAVGPAPPPPPPPAPSPPPPEPDRPYWTTPRIAGWVAIGMGVAAGVGALAFGLAVIDTQSEVDAMNHSTQPVDGARYNAVLDDGSRYQTWEIGLGVTGAGLLTGGVLLLVFGAPAKPSTTSSLSLAVEPGGARATYSLDF